MKTTVKTALDLFSDEFWPPVVEGFHRCRDRSVKTVEIEGNAHSGKSVLARLLTMDAALMLLQAEECPFGMTSDTMRTLAFVSVERDLAQHHVDLCLNPLIRYAIDNKLKTDILAFDTDARSFLGESVVHVVYDDIGVWREKVAPTIERRRVSRTGLAFPSRSITTRQTTNAELGITQIDGWIRVGLPHRGGLET